MQAHKWGRIYNLGREYGWMYGQGFVWDVVSQTAEGKGKNHSRSWDECGPLMGDSNHVS